MTTQTNPWIAQHVRAETEMQDGNSRVARALVSNEYSGAPKPVQCPHCARTAFYRATIGAMKCPDCGGLARTNGHAIG